MQMSVVLAILAVLAIFYFVPFVVYASASAFGWTEVPSESSPKAFLTGVLVTKLGTAVAFVLLLHLGPETWAQNRLLYALIWFLMFATSEIGDGISQRSTWPDVVLGIASEAIYAPAAAFSATRILGM